MRSLRPSSVSWPFLPAATGVVLLLPAPLCGVTHALCQGKGGIPMKQSCSASLSKPQFSSSWCCRGDFSLNAPKLCWELTLLSPKPVTALRTSSILQQGTLEHNELPEEPPCHLAPLPALADTAGRGGCFPQARFYSSGCTSRCSASLCGCPQLASTFAASGAGGFGKQLPAAAPLPCWQYDVLRWFLPPCVHQRVFFPIPWQLSCFLTAVP